MSSHALTCHTPSHVTHPHLSHALTCHTPSLVTHPHLSHALTCHTPSLVTCPHLSHALTCHTPSLVTRPHLSHALTCHTPSQTAAPKRWTAYDGIVTEMDTQFSLRAQQLRDIHQSITMTTVSADERLDILLTLKCTVKVYTTHS